MNKPILKHLGIIMDGNRRWAKKRGLPSLIGHQQGYAKVLKVGDWCLKRGIEVLTVWAFSTENWKRSKIEVSYLMNLLKQSLANNIKSFNQKGIRVQILGRLNELPKDLQVVCSQTVKLTANNKKAILNIAINYGGQSEILDAINKIIKSGLKSITLNNFQHYLYDPKMPKPDLIIRTAGELRTSGFLLWEAAYSELYFNKKPTFVPCLQFLPLAVTRETVSF